MKTLALISQKGGSGKTTLALHLAVLAERDGRRVLLIDTDPQQSTGGWWRSRQADTPELVECEAAELPAVLQAAEAEGVDLAVVDSAPHAARSAGDVLRHADLALVPCRPGILDLRAIGATVQMIRAARATAAIVLNACPPGRVGESGLTREARQQLDNYDVPVVPVAISQRAVLAHALIDGRAVTEMEPGGKAAAEIENLWEWTRDQLWQNGRR